jgi:hypothetical protein
VSEDQPGQGVDDVETASLLIEKALAAVDLAACSALCQLDPQVVQQGLAVIARAIGDHSALESLETLGRAGCHCEFLLWLLHPFSARPVFQLLDGTFYTPGPRNAEGLFKRGSTDVTKLLQRAANLATEIELLNLDFEFNYLLPSCGPELKTFWELPCAIRDYVKLMRHAQRQFGRGAEGLHSLHKARLTLYVKHETGRFHDREVSALIGAVTGETYDETAHRAWRHKHYSRLAKVWNPLPRMSVPAQPLT